MQEVGSGLRLGKLEKAIPFFFHSFSQTCTDSIANYLKGGNRGWVFPLGHFENRAASEKENQAANDGEVVPVQAGRSLARIQGLAGRLLQGFFGSDFINHSEFYRFFGRTGRPHDRVGNARDRPISRGSR